MSNIIRTFSLSITLLFLVFGSIAYAAPSQLWLNSTANTRLGAAEMQAQISAARANQQAKQQQEQLLQQRALELLTVQQKAMLQNMQTGTEQTTNNAPEFKPKPRTTTQTNNPWLKKNQWDNTQKNPYSGQQYKSNATTTPGSGGIYVKPDGNTTNTAQPSKPVNIFR